MHSDHIELRGVKTHNLKDLDIDIPHHALTVITGVSGSGKSSLAFDTLYAEGQRRFVESMSTYARQFLQRMEKPPLRSIKHVLPAIALRQKTSSSHARSTVGTLTELDDHLQILYARLGTQYCPDCDALIRRETSSSILEALRALGEGARVVFVADVKVTEVEPAQTILARLTEQGHQRLWIDGGVHEISAMDIESLLDADSFPVLVDRVIVKKRSTARIVEAIDAVMKLSGGVLRAEHLNAEGDAPPSHIFRESFACNHCGLDLIEPIPSMFNPNTTLGACPTCTGFGKTAGVDYDKVIPNPFRTLSEDAVAVFASKARRPWRTKLFAFARAKGIPLDVSWGQLSDAQRRALLQGGKGWVGVRGFFKKLQSKRGKPHIRILLARYRGYATCEDCEGARLDRQARRVLIGDLSLPEIYRMCARDASAYFEALSFSDTLPRQVELLLGEIKLRLEYMVHVGLGYLRLDRQTRTLSGGEFQRLHLTSSIGRALTDTLYVLDEPTAGLHARDSLRLLHALKGLRDLGNTVVVVEHDPEIIRGADWTVELGPMGGERGGQLLYRGDLEGLKSSDTPTGRMLTARLGATAPPRKPPAESHLTILGATEHNLQNITVHIPLGRLVCVTGVSGSGKSTLVQSILYDGWRARNGELGAVAGRCEGVEGWEQLEDIVMMSQKSLGRSSRSNAATSTKAFDPIRKLMSSTQDAKLKGITPGHFSFNTKGGRCEACEGTGTITIEMQFMADVDLTCEECDGHRFSDPVLAIRYRGKNIHEILDLTVESAIVFFKGSRAITNRLKNLVDVGLGYLRLGQTTSTLSGGEMQRLKLASYLPLPTSRKKSKKPSLFIFDEPTVGLHLQDVTVLLRAIRRLVDEGHSVLVVEHNTDFIIACDHIIDLGPEGGDGGGAIVSAGHPEDIAGCAESHTGQHLKALLDEYAQARS